MIMFEVNRGTGCSEIEIQSISKVQSRSSKVWFLGKGKRRRIGRQHDSLNKLLNEALKEIEVKIPLIT